MGHINKNFRLRSKINLKIIRTIIFENVRYANTDRIVQVFNYCFPSVENKVQDTVLNPM